MYRTDAFRGDTAPARREPLIGRVWRSVASYFSELDPTFWVAIAPALVVAALVYTRSPASNFIFDEQEALLANPYVNGSELHFLDAFRRDFWGLPPDRTIGSYRPLPNLVWWVFWRISELPWLPHWINIVVHAANAALVASFALALTRERTLGWFAGAAFLLAAVITEAVTGVVGLADVLGGLGVLLALHALRLPGYAMPFAVFGATTLGFFSKESVLCAVPLVGWAALVTAPFLHPSRPWGFARAMLGWLFAGLALVGYTYFRRHFFPVALPEALAEPLPDGTPLYERALHDFMRWFQQPRLPRDPINNPLVDADTPERIAGALRVYWHGLGQVLLPLTLSGDYSYSAEPVPARVVSASSVLGALLLVGPPLAGAVCWVRGAYLRPRAVPAEANAAGASPDPTPNPAPDPTPSPSSPQSRASGVGWALLAIGLVWVPIAYFPHSNIPTLLPTVRAERFWYLPVIGSSLVIGLAFARALAWRWLPTVVVAIFFFGFQALQARTHALHYSDDLAFWRAARTQVPGSAKAHLNYAVMVGARGRLSERLEAGQRAIDIAPQWAMAHVYQGDTLCRLREERAWDGATMAKFAWPHYKAGFELNPNDVNLVALGLQCLYDQKGLEHVRSELLALGDKHPSSWLDYLGRDTLEHGDEHHGVDPKYRPRGYNEGPKDRKQ